MIASSATDKKYTFFANASIPICVRGGKVATKHIKA
jgi:hypothetical protein